MNKTKTSWKLSTISLFWSSLIQGFKLLNWHEARHGWACFMALLSYNLTTPCLCIVAFFLVYHTISWNKFWGSILISMPLSFSRVFLSFFQFWYPNWEIGVCTFGGTGTSLITRFLGPRKIRLNRILSY